VRLRALPLLAQHELAPGAGCEHTLGVGVTATARVTFGRDQHMLGEGSQKMITKRTAIRGRLAVRRAANRPPWGGHKLGHGAIVAPLAATVAATLAATVAIGVGVALARAERDRRFARVERVRDRQFALLPGEPLTEGFRRMALSQLDLAIDLLAGTGGTLAAATSVHETRKALKRLRALIGLLRAELGERQFAQEDALLREAGLRLAGARDAEVLVATLDELVRANARKLTHRRGVTKLRRQLAQERDRATERTRDDAWARAQVVGELRALRVRVEAWSLPNRDGMESIEDGLRRIYRQGRRRRRRAARGGGGRGRAMHRWRKRVKDLRYAAVMLDRRDPDRGRWAIAGAHPGDSGHGRGHDRGDAGQIRRLARQADELGEMLGEEHDLALLAARLRATDRRGPGPRLKVAAGTRKALLKLIARRRRHLRSRALKQGKRLYEPKPGAFVRRVSDAYADAWLAG
jgi:CHAD domain